MNDTLKKEIIESLNKVRDKTPTPDNVGRAIKAAVLITALVFFLSKASANNGVFGIAKTINNYTIVNGEDPKKNNITYSMSQ